MKSLLTSEPFDPDEIKQILVYGDSLSWGIIPNTRKRLAFHQRWPGVVENELISRGRQVRIIEDCLNGRRTVWEDPSKPGRSGIGGFEQRIEAHSPLELVVLALGTNDFQSSHNINAAQSAQGIAAIIAAVRNAPVEPGMPIPSILVIAPPAIGEPKGEMATKFLGAKEKCKGLSAEYRNVTDRSGCAFFNAGDFVSTSLIDGVHLDVDQHLELGKAIATAIEHEIFMNG